jgi:hypothetical protein
MDYKLRDTSQDVDAMAAIKLSSSGAKRLLHFTIINGSKLITHQSMAYKCYKISR